MQEDFKYDVAFSFLAEDEALAQKINDLIKERVKTFIYSEKQLELAGKDGEKAFSEVFTEQTRVVVVLYRDKWGTTSWTRIEETVIRNRAFNEGYEFTIFIPIDDTPNVPKWLPKTQLYVGLKRWGIESAAGVIEAKVSNFGGEIKRESYIEKANLIKRKQDLEVRNNKLFNSERGVEIALEHAELIIKDMEEIIQNKIKGSISLENVYKQKNRVVYHFDKYYLDVFWFNEYINTINEGYLRVVITIGCPNIPGYIIFDEPKELSETLYSFDRDLYNDFGWRDIKTKMFYSIGNLVQNIFDTYFQIIDSSLE